MCTNSYSVDMVMKVPIGTLWQRISNRLRKQFVGSSEIEEIYLKDLIFPENIMLLNFNYTEVADKYGCLKVASTNHIHGDLNNPDSIIFGYGDEP